MRADSSSRKGLSRGVNRKFMLRRSSQADQLATLQLIPSRKSKEDESGSKAMGAGEMCGQWYV